MSVVNVVEGKIKTQTTDKIVPYANSRDVNVSNPSILFDSGNNGWVVGMNVQWTGTSWANDAVGGEEGFGVYLYNVTGVPSQLAVQSTYAALYDEDLNNVHYSFSRFPGSPSCGYGYRAQDQLVIGWPNYKYVGANIYASARYNNAFGLCSGVAQAFYDHTFANCGISSASITPSGPNVTFSSTSGHFSVASDNDVIF